MHPLAAQFLADMEKRHPRQPEYPAVVETSCGPVQVLSESPWFLGPNWTPPAWWLAERGR